MSRRLAASTLSSDGEAAGRSCHTPWRWWELSESGTGPIPTVLVVDMANVVGSVPDGWWRDRRGAAQRLLGGLSVLTGSTVPGPDGTPVYLVGILAVLEGAANSASDPEPRPTDGGVEIARAPGSGDDEIARRVAELTAAGDLLLVVTADRGLRVRFPPGVATTGPGWLNALLGRA